MKANIITKATILLLVPGAQLGIMYVFRDIFNDITGLSHW